MGGIPAVGCDLAGRSGLAVAVAPGGAPGPAPGGGFGGWDNRSRAEGKYNFTIVNDQGESKQALVVDEREQGWVMLGSYNFSSDTALVELSNKSDLPTVFADAVKFVKQ